MGTDGERDQNKSPDEISVDEIFKSFGIENVEELHPMFKEYLDLVSKGKTVREIADILLVSDNCREEYLLFYAMIGLAHVLDDYVKNICGFSVLDSMKEATEMLNVKKLSN